MSDSPPAIDSDRRRARNLQLALTTFMTTFMLLLSVAATLFGNVFQQLISGEDIRSSFLGQIFRQDPVLFGTAVFSTAAATATMYIVAFQIRRRLQQQRHIRVQEGTPPESYENRLTALAGTLTNLSRDMDNVLAQAIQVTTERQEKLKGVEVQLEALTARESELKHRIEVLEKTSPEAARYFSDLIESQNQRDRSRNWRRDIFWFVLGVIASIAVNILTATFFH